MDYLKVLRKNWLLLITSTVLGILISGLFSLSLNATYTASTKLFVAIQGSGTISELQQGNTFTEARVQSYVKTATTPIVLQPVIDSLGLSTSPASLARKVTASTEPNTVLISISVADESPVRAAAVATAVAESLVVAVEKLETTSEGSASPIRLSIVQPATAPASPSSPNMKMNLLVGLIIGLGLGLLAAMGRRSLDNKVRGESDLRKRTEYSLLGGITFDRDAASKPLLTQVGQQSPRAESFRQIRTNLQFANVSHTSKVILVTSSIPGEGKSTTASNMAIAIAQTGKKVALVDADLRRPMVADYLGLEGNAGLTTALLGATELDDLLQLWGGDDLHVLTSGQVPPNPSELLGSAAMSDLIDKLEANFDSVIIDAPPLLPVTDAAVLAQKVGGVVLVVGTGKVRTQDLDKALGSLKLVDADVLGIVLNLLPTKGPDAYAYSYYSKDSQQESRRKSVRRPKYKISGSHMKANRSNRGANPKDESRREARR
jgi:capsular exopolysaccharide synthesis family protein